MFFAAIRPPYTGVTPPGAVFLKKVIALHAPAGV
jgi:hypothetical protein